MIIFGNIKSDPENPLKHYHLQKQRHGKHITSDNSYERMQNIKLQFSKVNDRIPPNRPQKNYSGCNLPPRKRFGNKTYH